MEYLVDTDEPVPLSLPDQWLWDIIDEFIYQVRSFPPERKFLLLINCEVHSLGAKVFSLDFMAQAQSTRVSVFSSSFCSKMQSVPVHHIWKLNEQCLLSADVYKNWLLFKHSV